MCRFFFFRFLRAGGLLADWTVEVILVISGYQLGVAPWQWRPFCIHFADFLFFLFCICCVCFAFLSSLLAALGVPLCPCAAPLSKPQEGQGGGRVSGGFTGNLELFFFFFFEIVDDVLGCGLSPSFHLPRQ